MTTLAAQLKRLTTQLAERTYDSEGQNCQDKCALLGEAVQFLTDNVSNVPQELISKFQTLVEDQAQKCIVFQLKTVDAAIRFRAEGDHGHAAQAKVDLGWISKFVQETLLVFTVAAWFIDMQELVMLHKRIHGAIFSSELWTKLGSATTQLAKGTHTVDAEWLELQRQLELAYQQDLKVHHVIERINKLLVEIAAATLSWTQAIAVAQMWVPLSSMPHPEVYKSVLSCHISMRSLQTCEGHAWDVVPLSAEWMTAMAPLVLDAQSQGLASAAGYAGRAGALIPQPLLKRIAPFDAEKTCGGWW